MEKKTYYLGIDGGGTKTEFALGDDRGNILARLRLGATNPNDVGFDAAFATLKKGIDMVCAGTPFSQISAFAGLAGGSSIENQPKIAEFLSEFGFCKVANHNDAQNALAAALDGEDGVMVIMGTGSIAYAQSGNEMHRIGGYGYLFGDAGSGFAIGREVILAAFQHEDGSGANTLLWSLVCQKAGTETVLSAIDAFYHGGKRLLADYAPLAFEAYEKGDKVAEDILLRNLSAIADLVRGGAKKLPTNKVKVALCGGLTASWQIIMPILTKLLADEETKFELEICQRPPVWGALRLAGMPARKLDD